MHFFPVCPCDLSYLSTVPTLPAWLDNSLWFPPSSGCREVRAYHPRLPWCYSPSAMWRFDFCSLLAAPQVAVSQHAITYNMRISVCIVDIPRVISPRSCVTSPRSCVTSPRVSVISPRSCVISPRSSIRSSVTVCVNIVAMFANRDIWTIKPSELSLSAPKSGSAEKSCVVVMVSLAIRAVVVENDVDIEHKWCGG